MRIYLSIPFGSYLTYFTIIEVCVLDVIISLCAVVCARLSTCLSTCARLCATLIHLCRSCLHDVVEVGDGGVDGSHVGSLVSVLELLQSLLDARLLVGRNLVAVVLEEVLGGEDHRVSLVELVDLLALCLVRSCVLLCLSLHALDFLLAQT